LDYKEDLQFQNEVYRRLEPQHGSCFGTEEVAALLRREPQLIEINRHCEEKSVR
jgi:spore coat polysaccharide biosynthesis protein SpsF (cytidylyltransferase family)